MGEVMTTPGAYLLIAILAVAVLGLALRTRGMNPILAALAQVLVVVAAVSLVDPLGGKAIIALGITYYAGFFMGRAFQQEQEKPDKASPPRTKGTTK
jgi:hypothetical protein